MSDREVFFPNDMPVLVFEARRPNLSHFDDPDGVPANPTSVEVRFFNGTTGEMVEIDGSEVIFMGSRPDSLLRMEPMNEDLDRGAYIYVTVPLEVTSVPGNYTMYIRTDYENGLSVTQDQRIQISEYR